MAHAIQHLPFKKLKPEGILPTRGTAFAAGLDLYSCSAARVPARGKALVGTGLATAIPFGYYGRIAPRSGLALNHGIDVGGGVIDSDYRGELGVLLFNFSDQDFELAAGTRVAQLLIEKIELPEPVEVDSLEETARGAGGFGSTGT